MILMMADNRFGSLRNPIRHLVLVLDMYMSNHWYRMAVELLRTRDADSDVRTAGGTDSDL